MGRGRCRSSLCSPGGPSLHPLAPSDSPPRIHRACAWPRIQSSRTANGRLPNAPRLLPQRGEAAEPPGMAAPRPALMETWRLPGGGARLEQSPGTGPRLAARVSGRKLQGPSCLRCKPDLRAGPPWRAQHEARPRFTAGHRRRGRPRRAWTLTVGQQWTGTSELRADARHLYGRHLSSLQGQGGWTQDCLQVKGLSTGRRQLMSPGPWAKPWPQCRDTGTQATVPQWGAPPDGPWG